jgi:prophage regulatory protein
LHRSGTAFDGNIGTSIDSHEVTTMSQPSQREPAFLRRKDVQFRTGLARSTIYLYVQQGSFPKPVTLGPRAVAWLESEVSAWITERVRIARDCPARGALAWHGGRPHAGGDKARDATHAGQFPAIRL